MGRSSMRSFLRGHDVMDEVGIAVRICLTVVC